MSLFKLEAESRTATSDRIGYLTLVAARRGAQSQIYLHPHAGQSAALLAFDREVRQWFRNEGNSDFMLADLPSLGPIRGNPYIGLDDSPLPPASPAPVSSVASTAPFSPRSDRPARFVPPPTSLAGSDAGRSRAGSTQLISRSDSDHNMTISSDSSASLDSPDERLSQMSLGSSNNSPSARHSEPPSQELVLTTPRASRRPQTSSSAGFDFQFRDPRGGASSATRVRVASGSSSRPPQGPSPRTPVRSAVGPPQQAQARSVSRARRETILLPDASPAQLSSSSVVRTSQGGVRISHKRDFDSGDYSDHIA
ncbi:hypothetical protein IL306_006729 [Fusarium sp. DS 682]|nr:hypothetical protein IL306_006729 [Fusarium sp. DS 682]